MIGARTLCKIRGSEVDGDTTHVGPGARWLGVRVSGMNFNVNGKGGRKNGGRKGNGMGFWVVKMDRLFGNLFGAADDTPDIRVLGSLCVLTEG